MIHPSHHNQSVSTNTKCVNSGYGFDGDLCTSNTLVLTGRPVITVSDNKCATKTAGDYNGVIGKKGQTGDATLQAKPVILIRNTVSDTLPSTTSTTIPIGSSSPDASSSGLSTGAKIAIGVCVPVAILIAAAVLFIFWHRRRRQRRSDGDGEGSEIQLRAGQPGSPTAGDPFLGKPELDGGVVGAGAASSPKPQEKMELDAGANDGVLKYELGDGQKGWKRDSHWQPPAELPEAEPEPVELPVERSPTELQELGGGQDFGGKGSPAQEDQRQNVQQHVDGQSKDGHDNEHETGRT